VHNHVGLLRHAVGGGGWKRGRGGGVNVLVEVGCSGWYGLGGLGRAG